MGFEGGRLALYFVEPSGLPVTFRLEARQAIGPGTWVGLNATLEGPDAQGRDRYLNLGTGRGGEGIPGEDRARFYSVTSLMSAVAAFLFTDSIPFRHASLVP